jgi:predicted Rossmann fold nucleotide-binding protein DprA/Smf involved in DNA uptake
MHLGIVGSRRRNTPADKSLIKEKVLDFLKSGELVIVSGGCKLGADRFAEEIADELNLPIIIFYPKLIGGQNRMEYAKAAYARNKLIAQKADVLIACVAADRKGGTENTIEEFIKKDRCNYALHREILILV